jgi:hypothetical protein
MGTLCYINPARRVSTGVVQLICNQKVGGSNPSPGTRNFAFYARNPTKSKDLTVSAAPQQPDQIVTAVMEGRFVPSPLAREAAGRMTVQTSSALSPMPGCAARQRRGSHMLRSLPKNTGASGMTPREVIECPHCGEATQVNRLPQGSAFCSCAAQKPLPPTGAAGDKHPLKQ